MCDFFLLSPADQGDLSDVVRASLQQPPPPPHHHRLPAAATPAAPTVCSLGSHHLPEEDGLLLLQAGRVNFGGDDHDEAHSPSQRQQQQLVHGNNGGMVGLMLGSNGSGSCACDHAAALCPQLPEAVEGRLIPQPPMSGPQPQLMCAPNSSFVERDDDDAPVLEEHVVLDMPMAPHHPYTSATKRRKSQTKKVVCIPAPVAAPPGVGGRPSTSGEVVPSDLWAWRKYGQKPIKGSPYPRGYYRCSSSKGCSARKQVERSRTDPSMLVITYTSDYNHPWPTQRNALAGSTRPAASSSSAGRSHHHHHQRHSTSTVAVPDTTTPVHRRHARNVAVADNATPGSVIIIGASGIHHQLLKQEVLDIDMDNASNKEDAAADHDCLGMFADMDGALCASDLHPKKQQQQATTAQHLEKLPEEEDKQLLLGPDPFSFSFFDWVGASFGVGETAADNDGGHTVVSPA